MAVDTITGTPGDDQLTGTSGPDQIYGLGGNDGIYGAGGADTIDAGSGNDKITAGAGSVITTGDGQDTIESNFASVTITDFTPGAGGDVLWVDNGHILGNSGLPDFSTGLAWLSQDGPDAILNIGPINIGTGGPLAGTQIIFKNVNADLLTADNIGSWGPFEISHLDPQVGSYRGSAQNDVLVGGASNDHLFGSDGNDTLFGGAGDDTHSGGNGNDLLVDDQGSDALNGDAGNDTLWGGAGVDFLFGGPGADELHGQAGNNVLSGGPGADRFVIDASDGGDWITDFNSAEGDRVVLPPGVTYSLQAYSTNGVSFLAVTLSTGQVIGLPGVTAATLGNWIDNGSPPNETLFGTASNDTIAGGAGNDVIVGDKGADNLNGGAGNDTLWGGDDTDFLFGGAGNDQLAGQGGNDLLSGGPGADRFLIGAGEGNDWITDFSSAEGDHVVLSPGVTFILQQYDWGAAAVLSTGQVIGLQGVTTASLAADWAVYA